MNVAGTSAVSMGHRDAAKENKLREFEKTAQAFEAVFVQMMLSQMRKSVHKSEIFSGGRGEEAFTPLLDQNLAELAARRNGGLGIGRLLLQRYSKSIEREQEPAGPKPSDVSAVERFLHTIRTEENTLLRSRSVIP